MVTDIGINIAASIIYDVAKKLYNFAKPEDNQVRASIKKHLKDRISTEFTCLLETGGIEQFFKLPQVCDAINSYVIYVINGKLTDILIKMNKQKHNSQIFASKDDVIKYLVRSYGEYNRDSIISNSHVELERFIRHIFSLANEYFIERLDINSKVEVFQVNQLFMHGFNSIFEKLNRLSTNIDSILKYPLLMKNPEYDKLCTEYMGIMKRKHNKALIYLLDDFDLDKFYIPPKLSANSRDRIVRQHIFNLEENMIIRSLPFELWENIFVHDNIIYITGGAGYGKTLLMKNIIINYNMLNVVGSYEHIVIYGEIKWFIKKDGSFKPMTEFLRECITNATLKDYGDDFVNYHLETGRCILLLDALDEVQMDRRKELHQTIIAHLKTLNPNNKVCLTSRDRGFIPVEEDIAHFNIEPLDAGHIEKYVDKIIKLKKFNQEDKKPFMEQAKSLIEKRFLNSFLILSLLINIYKGERELPETKLELYQKCLEYIANKREKPKTDDNFDWKLISPLMKDNTFIELSLLCFPNNKEIGEKEITEKLKQTYKEIFTDAATLENAISEFLKFCSERTELFVPANVENSFKFFHRSFFEYFFSKHIVIRCKDSFEIYNSLIQFDVDSEIFELTLARLKQETQDKYISLIKYTFEECENDFKRKKPNFKALNVLVLFFQVIDEETFQNRFIDLVIENSTLIIENIKKISNQEIINSIINRSNSLDSVIKAYDHVAYQELQQLIKMIDDKDVEYILNHVDEQNDLFFRRNIIFRGFNTKYKPLHFYSIALFSRYDTIEILNNLLKNPALMGGKQKSRTRKLVELYDTLTERNKKVFNKIFPMILDIVNI